MNNFEELLMIIESDFEPYTYWPEKDCLVSIQESENTSIPEGTIIRGYFPYREPMLEEHGPSTTVHWGVILHTSDYGTIAVKGTSIKSDKFRRNIEKLKKIPFNYIIPDYKLKGFSKETVIKGGEPYKLEWVEDWVIKGKVTPDDVKEIRTRFNLFISNRFKILECLIAWLKFENFQDTVPVDGKNNNNNRLQTPTQMEQSKHANCVDISTLAHHVCTILRIEHRIVNAKFSDNFSKHSSGHFFVMYKRNKFWRAFRFMAGNNSLAIGNIALYQEKDERIAALKETGFLKPHFIEKYGPDCKERITILTDAQVTMWDAAVIKGWTQAKMLETIGINEKKQ